MKSMSVLALVTFATLTLVACNRPVGPKSLVFTDVTVIDATGSPAKPNMMVVVVGDKITRIEKYQIGSVPKNADVVAATGKFLIPGLWDMHVHWYDERYLPLFIANGVTGVRQMWGMDVHREWRRRINDGSLIGPRMAAIASIPIDGPKPVFPGSIAVQNEVEGRAAVIQSKKDGADFIKVYEQLPRNAYFAIVDQAKKEGLPFAGHVPFTLRTSEVSDAGQKSIEHLTGIFIEASTHEETLRKLMIATVSSSGPAGGSGLANLRLSVQLLAGFDAQKAVAIYQRLAKNHTWQVPTLTLLRAFSRLGDPDFVNDPRLKYIPQSIREQWKPENESRIEDLTPEDWANSRKLFEKQLEVVGEMHRAGVPMLAGTDIANPFCFPGFSLHDELTLLVKAGLTPMDAIQAATRNAADYLGMLNSFGTVETGKTADLLLLDADPLDDIRNTQKIAGVTMGGKFLPRSSLSQMLKDVEALAARKPIGQQLWATITISDVSSAIEQYRHLKKEQPAIYEFGEDELNGLGYRLLQTHRTRDAIEIFKLNVEAFPKSGNAYDSLAEAYLANGDRDLSIANYKHSLELSPANHNAEQQLKKIQAK
jgi:hypothetical protein